MPFEKISHNILGSIWNSETPIKNWGVWLYVTCLLLCLTSAHGLTKSIFIAILTPITIIGAFSFRFAIIRDPLREIGEVRKSLPRISAFSTAISLGNLVYFSTKINTINVDFFILYGSAMLHLSFYFALLLSQESKTTITRTKSLLNHTVLSLSSHFCFIYSIYYNNASLSESSQHNFTIVSIILGFAWLVSISLNIKHSSEFLCLWLKD